MHQVRSGWPALHAAIGHHVTMASPTHGWHEAPIGRHVVRSRVLAPHDPAHDVVLLHGLGVSSAYMVPLLEQLGRSVRCWAPDLPGHGRSSSPRVPLDTYGQANVLGQWLLDLRMERPVVVANSWGCQVAVELARGGVPLAGLVLVGPSPEARRRSLGRHVVRLAADQAFEPRHLTAIQAVEYFRTGPIRTYREFRSGQRFDLRAALADVDAPVVLVRGSRDTIVPRRWLDELARHQPRARVVEVEGAPHCANYTSPAVIAEFALALTR